MLVVAVAAAGASTAQAHGTGLGTTEITCSHVTLFYSEFPNAPNNTVTQQIKVHGEVVYTATFSFNGPSGSDTVAISAPNGEYSIDAHGVWKTNGVSGNFDDHNKVNCEPHFSIEKLQEIKGSGTGFTTHPLTGQLGQTVDYEIIVSNTGNLPLTFSNFTDPNCGTLSGGPGSSPVAPGESTAYTCEHLLSAVGSYANEASDTGTPPDGPPITNTSNKVLVNVPAEPAFTIEKLQEIKGSGTGFATLPLIGKLGQTVDYEIIVSNTGNVPLTFSNFTDPNCGTLSGGPGESPLAPGATTTYTCEHLLSVGSNSNEASDTGTPPEGEGSPITNTSNKVLVNVPAEPAFTIEKLQEIKGSGTGFTTLPLTGKLGETVDYEIIVSNTGNVPLTFSNFTDANCGTVSGGPGESPLAPGATTTYTCEHLLNAVGTYSNEASDTGTPPEGEGSPATNTSNKVLVNVPAEPAFTIEKLQEIKGSGTGFTTLPLTGEVGETVDYEIIVSNTGNVPLTFSNFTDANCGTVSGGPGESPLAPGAATTYTCEHLLNAVGTYSNEASDTGTPTEGSTITTASNRVLVNVPAEPAFTIEKLQEIKGSGSGVTTLPITGEVGETVDYEIIVSNTGNVPLTFSKFTDTHCDKGTISGGPGSSPVAPGASTTYFCDHVLTSHDRKTSSYSNTATVTGTPPAGEGSPATKTSNTVVVNFPGHGGGSGTTEITCTRVTFFYTDFPNVDNNMVTQYIKIDGVLVSTTTFTFNGPTGSDTVTISAPPGKGRIDTRVKWKTNGASGNFDHHVKVVCE